jgi:predicted RNA binding protein YcfA (HicA-like mRNA interferase family)
VNDKLIRKFLTDSKHITIENCDELITGFGYELKRGSGSHRTYHKKGTRPITVVVPKGTKYIYSVYVSLIIKILKLED